MDAVYGASTCNIAAANAQNGSEGLFRGRKPKSLPPSTTPVRWQGMDIKCKVVRNDFWSGELLSETLYQRAW